MTSLDPMAKAFAMKFVKVLLPLAGALMELKKKNFNLISQEHIMSRDIPNHSHTAVQELLAVEPDGY